MNNFQRYFSRRKQLAWVTLSVALFAPVSFVLPYNQLLDVLNAVAVAIGLGVVVAYGYGLLDGFRRNRLTAGHLLVAGIILSWLGVIIRLVTVWLNRLSGGEWIQTDTAVMSFAVWVFILGGALHLTARNAIDYHIPRSNWMWLGFLLAVGTAAGLLLVQAAT